MRSTIPTTDPLPPGTAAPDVLVQAADGSSVGLMQYWRRQPVLLFFVRSFGCVFCRDQLRLFRQRYAEFQARGVEIVAIAPSDAISAEHLARGLRLPFPVMGDLQRQAFAAYGLYETTLGELAKPEVVIRNVQQIARGNLPVLNPLFSTFTQLGGSFIIDTTGVVRFGHAATPVFAYPSIDTYLAMFDNLPSPDLF
jgi:peroxiredoxin